VSEDRSQQNTDAEEAPARRRGRDDGVPARGRQRAAGDEPDVILDVSQLEVERITLEVDDLRAHVSILAELANLVSLSVGADVQLGRVKLEIEGVKAQVLLEVRLEHVRAILEKALETIAENPEILEILGQTLSDVLRETLGTARATLEEALEGLEVGDTVDEALRSRLEEVRDALEDVLEGQGEGGREESGGPAQPAQNEVQATPAARRAAEELGVDLSRLEGTGAGGRITVRDVRNAAQEE
jgi:pyruvate/2-oxoglutarate dehydrogenase complex dihydrolipoamide acyltransferase (E2) component